MKPKGVSVTGLGCICAAGDSVASAMNAMYRSVRNPDIPKRIQAKLEVEYPVFEVASEITVSDPMATRTSLLALQAANEALNQSNLDEVELQKWRVGVCLGTTVGCTLNNEPFYRDYKTGKNPDLSAINRYLGNNPALYIADKFKCKGPTATIANACSSGTDAIGLAKSWLENDLCDIVITGGADELSRITYLGFISLLISSTEACRPFDKYRKGLNLGEGAGIVIIEKPEVVKARSSKTFANIVGYATFADAYHPTAPHPEGIGLTRAIHQAMTQAKIDLEQIGFINAHGTSTQNNDEVEGSTIAKLFSDKIPTVSTKGYTGHTLGAAGGVETVFAIQGLLDQKLPATPGFEEFDPACGVTPTTSNTNISAEFALSNSLAFGGNNSALIFQGVQQ
ncbi:MAG: beta-ketoacyl-[acyl-carrier-protein] synthase family protein [Calditrichaceae bacterium]|jgi:3-oxoacyl-[acyl-carrier-protein] synthase-1/3-oxoacyl-[acyl-carrier-protein] synthase II